MIADRFTFAAAIIVAVGALMRLYAVIAFTWDQDELYTRIEARELFRTTLPPGIDARPLFYILEHPVLSILPQTAPMLRLLPFVIGVAGLWLTWIVGRRCVGRVGGLVATLVASLSTWQIEASAQARYYSLVYLFAVLVLLWIPQASDSDRPAAYMTALVALALGVLTHPSFVFPTAGIVVGALCVGPRGEFRWPWPSRAGWLYLWGPFILFLSLFFAALKLANRQHAFRNSGGRGLAASLRLVPGMVEWITPVVLAAAFIGTVCLLCSRRAGHRRLGVMCCFSVVTTFGGLFAASFWTATYTIYGTALLPLMFVTAGVGAQTVAETTSPTLEKFASAREWMIAAAAAAFLIISIAPATISYLADGSRFDYRPAYRQIEREDPTRPVVTWPGVMAQEYAPTLHALPFRPDRAYLDSLLGRYKDFWVITSVKRSGIALDDTGEADSWIAAHCRRRAAFERPRLDYRVYRVELHRCATSEGS
jgi:hypothetical protein